LAYMKKKEKEKKKKGVSPVITKEEQEQDVMLSIGRMVIYQLWEMDGGKDSGKLLLLQE